ncbi:MAG: response regulator [Magnetococcales bacterium]|nr:response regulator [Magnetococcales bacterium]
MPVTQQTQSSRWMTRRYLLALGILALLSCTAYGVLTVVLAQQEGRGVEVNISGRQRMLSQRTALFVQRLLLSDSEAAYQQAKAALREATLLMERSHNGLTRGSEELGLSGRMSPSIYALYYEGDRALDPLVRRYLAALRQVLETPFGQLKVDLESVQLILSTAPGPLLAALDGVVWRYQQEGDEIVAILHRMEGGVLFLTLFTLLLELLFVFRPMVRQVLAQIHHLQEGSEALSREVVQRTQAQQALQRARDELEIRVEERTASLSWEIAERRKVEKTLRGSEQRFRAMADSAMEGIIAINALGSIVTWNAGAARIFLREEAEVLGASAEILMPEPLRHRYKAGLARLAQGGMSRIVNSTLELQGLRKNGEEFPLELSLSTWSEGEQTFYTGIVRDISARKRSELALQQAREQAESATLAKSQFLATMSHEIRTPINALLGMGELLLETTLTEEQRRFLEISNQSGAALLALINDILDLSKIEAGQLVMESVPFDLHNLVVGTVDILNLLARERSNRLSLNWHDALPRWVCGDPGRLRQVLLNLINNAIKFTDQGRVTLTVRPESEGGQRLYFAVEDTGIGIAEEKLESIFLPFSQADSSVTRTHGGTGLGLTICRQIIQHAGGTLGVQSRLGQGSLFYFTWPLPGSADPAGLPVAAPQECAQQSGPLSDSGRTPLVLLAEDAEENQILIRAFLKRSRYRLQIVENGAQAVEQVKGGACDLVLMDIQMPVMDGCTAIRLIREWERQQNSGSTLPIIALTADAMRSSEEQATAAGCTLYLTKPISKRHLLETLASYLPA